MPALRTVPGLRLLLCILAAYFVAGFLGSGILLEVNRSFFWFMVLIISIGGMFLKLRSYHHLLFGISFSVLLFFLALDHKLQHENRYQEILVQVEDDSLYTLKILDSSQRRNSWRTRAKILKGPLKGKYCYLYTREEPKLDIGTIIRIDEHLERIPPTINPDQFDYQLYLLKNQIIGRIFVDPSKIQIVGKKISLLDRPLLWQKYLLNILTSNIHPENLSIAQALILGYRDELDPETRSLFIDTGTMHLLAISGMHMGILAWLLYIIFHRLMPYRSQKIYALLSILICLWMFSAITGFTSSAVRAVIMISLFLLGRHFMKAQNSYNILFITCSVMLLLNPSYFEDIGFQLSFLAVLSILFFYPRIHNLFVFKNRILQWSWSIIALGIAAQIGTLGISLHNFHVFSPWFWLTGIPGAFFASLNLILGLVLLLVANLIPWLTIIVTFALNIGLDAFRATLEASYIFQWHHFDQLFWTKEMVFWYYVFLVFLAFYLAQKYILYWRMTLASALCFLLFLKIDLIRTSNQFEILKVQGLKAPVYEITRGNQVLIYNPNMVPNDQIEFMMKEHRTRNRIRQLYELNAPLKSLIPSILLQDDNKNICQVSLPIELVSGPDKCLIVTDQTIKNPSIISTIKKHQTP